MGTPFREVYETFLGKIDQDEWDLTKDLGNLEQDWLMLLKSAINRFMYPRVSLKYIETDQCFTEELGQQEIQLLAVFMKSTICGMEIPAFFTLSILVISSLFVPLLVILPFFKIT